MQDIIDKLDIIIPVYKAGKQLQKTIFSFGSDYCYHFIIIIDGLDEYDYQKDLSIFNNIHDIKIYFLSQNMGPGIARNKGIELSNKEMITFIDAGDTLVSSLTFNTYLKQADMSSDFYMLSAAHYEEKENNELQKIGPEHNRMHGKIFRKSFLENFNIKFNSNCARMNEDIGINMSARMICKEISLLDGKNHICHFVDPIICWRNEPNSITRRNNCAFYYKENNMGLAKNGSYAIKLAIKNGVRAEIIEDQIYSILVSLFNFYYATKNFRPEFLDEQEEGAIYFVKDIMEDREINYQKFTSFYNQEMAGAYAQTWNPFTIKIPDMTFMQWYEMIKNKSINYKI